MDAWLEAPLATVNASTWHLSAWPRMQLMSPTLTNDFTVICTLADAVPSRCTLKTSAGADGYGLLAHSITPSSMVAEAAAAASEG